MPETNGDSYGPSTVPSPAPEAAKESEGVRLVTVLYSLHRDVYRIPSVDKDCWLSVMVYKETIPEDQPALYLGSSVTADGRAWRKAYLTKWAAILPGDTVTLPADDPMVLDYLAADPGWAKP